MDTRILKLGGALAASAALVSGCGGSSNSTLSASAFSSAANKICASAHSNISALQNSDIDKATPVAAATLQKVLTAGQQAEAKLKALKGPAGLEAIRNQFDVNFGEQVAVIQNMISEAKMSNQSDYLAAAQQLGPVEKQGNAVGAKLNAPACAK